MLENRARRRRLAALFAFGGALTAFTVTPVARAACCYFAAKDKDINQPGQKAFINWMPSDKFEEFTVQPKFEGNAIDFGMVIPTPSQPKLAEMPRDFFKDLAIYTILMPLPEAIWTGLEPPPMPSAVPKGAITEGAAPVRRDSTVKVLESGVVGSLDYKIIVAERADDLYQWLKDNKYSYSGDEATLDFYVKKKWFFTVMKIDSKAMKKAPDGSYLGEITPTRFRFDTDKCIYPLKITQISVKTATDALFYVQSPEQMDLDGDLSWMHSYRVMYLTYMLGCGASPEQQRELEEHNRWLEAKRAKNPGFETCKLEWARKLGEDEIAVLEDPLKNYAQLGNSTSAPGARVLSLEELLKDVWNDYLKEHPSGDHEDAKTRLKELESTYSTRKGRIVKSDATRGFYGTAYTFYPDREAPDEDVKGLTRLKGHLQKNSWLTKFRKQIRKDEMADDLLLVPVTKGNEQDYVRVMPTSPP
jgi:hypothetical protein